MKERFILPNHKLFCLVKKRINNETLENFRKKLKRKLKNYNDIYYSVSFELDYTAIDVYSTENENEYIYRISPGDFDEDTINKQFLIFDKILK